MVVLKGREVKEGGGTKERTKRVEEKNDTAGEKKGQERGLSAPREEFGGSFREVGEKKACGSEGGMQGKNRGSFRGGRNQGNAKEKGGWLDTKWTLKKEGVRYRKQGRGDELCQKGGKGRKRRETKSER